MQELMPLFNTQLVLFALLGLGVLCTRLGLLGDKTRSALTDLILNIFLPCTILSAFMVSYNLDMLVSIGLMLAVSLGLHLFCIVLNLFLYRRVPLAQRRVLQYGTLVSNASFMGNAMVEGIYGLSAIIYATAYLLPMRILMWTVGLSYFTKSARGESIKKMLLHPCILATVAGIVLLLTGWQPPAFATKTIQSLAACTTALSMMVIGSLLAGVKVRSVVSKTSLIYCAIRLVGIPLLTLLAMALLRLPATTAAVAVVLSGMPAGTTTAILAEKYGCDAEFGSKIVFLSTLLSLGTIPLLAMLTHLVLG